MKRLALLLVIAACGGDDSGGPAGGTVTGTIGGRPVFVADAVSSNTDYPVGSGSLVLHYGTVVLGEAPAICDLAATQTAPPADEIVISILATTLETNPSGNTSKLPTVGTYTINAGSGNLAFATIHLDGTCATFEIKATTGTVTLTSASPTTGRYAGSFDLMLGSGDHITGTFNPNACPALTDQELACR